MPYKSARQRAYIHARADEGVGWAKKFVAHSKGTKVRSRSSMTKAAMKGPFANGPRYGGPMKGRPVPKRKAKLAPDKGVRRYLTRM